MTTTTTTTTILGIAGSLRRASLNRTLLTAAGQELPEHASLVIFDGLGDVPPFDEDAEAGEVPPAVAELRAAIEAADGLLFATPEYNGSIPGQLKNALDWASRPREAASLAGKPAMVIGASPLPQGATWAQQELRKVLGLTGAEVTDSHLPVPHSFRQFDENGGLLDDAIRDALREQLADLTTRINPTSQAA